MGSNNRLQAFLESFRGRFEPALEVYLKEQIINLGELDPSGQEMVEIIGTFISGGGKRIRAALVDIGYQAAGGENRERILKPAIAMELLHAFFLVHDDIMDRSDLRRGQPTVHRVYKSKYLKLLKDSGHIDDEHFAESMAILAGDMCCAMAYRALTESDFPSAQLIRATQTMHTMVDETVVGQILDILTPIKGMVGENEVMKIHRFKTACYTFRGPLQLGMVFAGASDEKLETISQYAMPIGIAFQIKDDLLGVFGTEAEVGKSVTSDLEEGKETLLTVYARAHGTPAQKKEIASLISKHPISMEELNRAREIFREIGAISYCEEKARELVQNGKKALESLNLKEDIVVLLADLADHVISRTT